MKPRVRPFAKGNAANPNGRPKRDVPPSERTRRKNEAQDVRALARAEGEASLQLLVKVRDDETAKMSVRVAAANSLLDRGFGKAPQAVEVTGDQVAVHVDRDDLIERIEGRIAGIRERLREQGVLPQLN